MNQKELLKGNIAIAKAAISAGCSGYFGYPITPQTEIGEYLSVVMQEKKLAYVCAESEVAAINMALGAATSGEMVMTSSSSCAVSLMQEAISYASSDELPIVIVNVMRAGPGQGYIYPSQGDYNQTVVGGGNGDYKNIVLAPSDVQECADMTQKAFYLAQKYRTPTFLLLDGLLGQMAEPAVINDYPYPTIDNSSWILNGAKNRESRRICSLEPNQDKLNRHIGSLYQKYLAIEQNEVEYDEFMCEDAEYIITAFGSMARHCKALCQYYREKGYKFGLFRPKTLYPFPALRLRQLAIKAKQVIDIEMNLGQMLKDVQLAVLNHSVVSFIGKPVGDWLKQEEMISAIDNILIKERHATSI